MSIALTLLADVRWRGRPVAGDRPQALLAALADSQSVVEDGRYLFADPVTGAKRTLADVL